MRQTNIIHFDHRPSFAFITWYIKERDERMREDTEVKDDD